MVDSIYDQVSYDTVLYDAQTPPIQDKYSRNPQKSGGFSIFFNEQKVADTPRRDNCDFFKEQKGDQGQYPNTLVKQRSNEPYSETDFIATPLMPSVKPRQDNIHLMDLEKSRLRNITNVSQQPAIRKLGWEGKKWDLPSTNTYDSVIYGLGVYA